MILHTLSQLFVVPFRHEMEAAACALKRSRNVKVLVDPFQKLSSLFKRAHPKKSLPSGTVEEMKGLLKGKRLLNPQELERQREEMRRLSFLQEGPEERGEMPPELLELLLGGADRPEKLEALYRYYSSAFDARTQKGIEAGIALSALLEKIVAEGADGEPKLQRLAATASSYVKKMERGERLHLFVRLSSKSKVGELLAEKVFEAFGAAPQGGGRKEAAYGALVKIIEKGSGKNLESLKNGVREDREEIVRNIREGVARLLPASWCERFEKSLVEDAHELFAECSGSEELAERYWKRLEESGIEAMIEKAAEEAVEKGVELSEKGVATIAERLTDQLPPLGRQLLSDSALGIGEQWAFVEIEKSGEKCCRLRFYANSSDMNLPAAPPFIYEGIDEERLSEDFFYRILSYRAWPQWGRAEGYSLRDFSEGLLASLEAAAKSVSLSDEGERLLVDASGPCALFRAYASRHSGRDRFEELKGALLQLWCGVDGDLKAVYSERVRLQAAASALLAEGRLRYREGSEQLKRAAATVWEVREKLLEAEKFCAPQVSQVTNAPATLLPEPVREQLLKSADLLGLNGEHVEIFKEALVGILGEEFRKMADNLLSELLPLRQSGEGGGLKIKAARSGASRLGMEELQALGGELRAFRPSLLHIYRLASKGAATALHPVVGTLLGSALHGILLAAVPGYQLFNPLGKVLLSRIALYYGADVLEKLFPPWMSRQLYAAYSLYYEVKRYILNRIFLMLLQKTLRAALSEKGVEQLRRRMERMQQQITRDGELSFALPGNRIEPERLHIAAPSASMRKREGLYVKCPSEEPLPFPDFEKVSPETFCRDLERWIGEAERFFVTERQHQQQYETESRRPQRFIDKLQQVRDYDGYARDMIRKWEAQGKEPDFRRLYQIYCAKNSLPEERGFEKWLASCGLEREPKVRQKQQFVSSNKSHLFFGSHYLNSQVRKLPPPNDRFWDRIDDPLTALERLSRLLQLLACCEAESYLQRSEIVASLYALYALIDRLARRCPESYLSEEFRPNGAHLMFWAGSSAAKSCSRKTYRQLEATADYFGIDIKRGYSFKEIAKASENCLFHDMKSWFLQDSHISRNGRGHTLHGDFFFYSWEASYLKKLLQDEEVQKKLSERGVDEKASLRQKQAALYMDNPRGLLPAPFYHLRMAHTLAANRMEDYCVPTLATVERGLFFKEEKNLRDLYNWRSRYPRLWKMDKQVAYYADAATFSRFSLWRFHSSFKYSGREPREVTESRLRYEREWCMVRRVKAFIGKEARDEYNLGLKFLNGEKKDPAEVMLSDGNRDELGIFSTAQERKKIRMLLSDRGDHLMRAVSFFTSSLSALSHDENRFLLELFLHRLGAFPMQLEESREAAEAVGRFFKKALKHFDAKRNYEAVADLCVTGLSLKEYAGAAAKSFPDFRRYIRSLLDGKGRELPRELQQLFGLSLIASRCEEPFPEEEALWDYGRVILGVGESFDRKMCLRELYALAKPVLERWRPLFYSRMDEDPDFRAEMLRILLQEEKPRSWQGEFPHYVSGEKSFDALFLSREEEREQKSLSELISQATRGFHDEKRPVVKRPEGFYAAGSLEFYIRGEKEFEIFLKHEGKRFRLIQRGALPDLSGKGALWLEEAPEAERLQLLRTEKKELVETLELQRRSETEFTYDTRYKEIGGTQHYELELEKSEHGLSLLSWFAPLTKLRAYCLPDAPEMLSRLEFPEFGLSFNVKNERAYAESLPGFYLAKQQKIPELAGLSRYLLLENARGEKRVYLNHSGMEARLLYFALHSAHVKATSPFLKKVVEQHLNKQRIFCYRLEKKGRLKSGDPEAIASLLANALCERNDKEAPRLLEEFETVARREGLSDGALRLVDDMIFFLGFSRTREAAVTTLRLSAAVEENKRLHRVDKWQHGFSFLSGLKGELLYWTVLQSKYRQYLDEQWEGVTEFQELFAGRLIKGLNRKFLKENLKKLPGAVVTGASLFGLPAVAERICMVPSVASRINFLEAKHAERIDFKTRAVSYMTEGRGLRISGCRNLFSKSDPFSVAGSVARRALQLFSSPLLRSGEKEAGELHRFLKAHICEPQDFGSLPVRFFEIGEQQLHYNYIAYMLLACGMVPEEHQAKAEEFRKSLRLMRGRYAPNTELLLEILLSLSRSGKKWEEIEDYATLGRLSIEEIKLLCRYQQLQRRYDEHWIRFKSQSEDRELFERVKDAERKLKACRDQAAAIMAKHSVKVEGAGGDFAELFFKAFVMKLRRKERYRELFSGKNLSVVKQAAKECFLPPLIRYMASSWIYSLPCIGWVYFGATWLWRGATIFRAEKAIREAQNDVSEPEGLGAPLYLPALQKREDKISSFFSALFDRYFICSEQEQGEAPAEEIEGDFKTLNRSIRDYNAREKERGELYTLKEGADREKLVLELEQMRSACEAQLKKERERILEYANRERERPMAFKPLLISFVRGELDADSALETRLLLYLCAASRFELFFKTVKSGAAPEEVARALRKKRVYSFEHEENRRLLIGKLAFEYFNGTLLWKKPMQQLDEMLKSGERKQVMELIMGSGKSFYGGPMAAVLAADGGEMVFSILPAPTFKGNMEMAGRQVKRMAGQASAALGVRRAFNWTAGRLKALDALFKRTLVQKELNSMVKESAQALELIGIEEGVKALEKQPKSLERFGLFRSLLRKVRQKGRAVIDEAHFHFHCKKELNHPLGPLKRLNSGYARIIEEAMHHLASDPELAKIVPLKAEKWTPVDEKLYFEKVMPKLAEKFFAYEPLRLEERERGLFLLYVQGKADKIPPFKKASEAAMVKGVLTVLLPHSLKEIVSVDFCPSIKNNGSFSRPSEGNVSPLEDAIFKSPYEAYVKTCQSFLHSRLTAQQIEKFMTLLRAKACSEADRTGKEREKTAAARYFKNKCGKPLFSLKQEDREEAFFRLNQNDRFVLDFVHRFVAKEITYYEYNLCSDSQNFASMFASFYSYTGSIYNADTYAEGTKVIPDRGTTGESIQILQSRCGGEGRIAVLEERSASGALEHILESFFKTGMKNSALIDRGALLRGMDNKSAAKAMLAFIEKERPDIDGIVFYDADGELVVFEKGGSCSAPLSSVNIPPERRITYFDQAHTFAADIPQPEGAEAIVTVGEETILEELAQAVWRMRGLKKLGQSLTLVLLAKVAEKIAPGKRPSVESMIQFVVRNQHKRLAEENYHSDRQKIVNVVRRAVLDKILEAGSDREALEILKEFLDLLRSRVEDDPMLLFGLIDREEDPYVLIGELKEQCFTALEALGKAQQVQQHTANEEDQEVECEQQVSQNQAQNPPFMKRSSPKFIAWPESLNSGDLNWLDEGKAGNVSLYSLKEALQKAEHQEVREVADAFSPNIFITENFAAMQKGTAPFGPCQLPVFEVLVIQEEGRTKIVMLHPWEIDYWRKKLREARASEASAPFKSALFDITSGVAVAYGKNRPDLESRLFKRLIAQVKFLNADVSYPKSYRKLLENWLRFKGPGVKKMRRAFLSLYNDHKIQEFHGSDLEKALIRASEESLADQRLRV